MTGFASFVLEGLMGAKRSVHSLMQASFSTKFEIVASPLKSIRSGIQILGTCGNSDSSAVMTMILLRVFLVRMGNLSMR
ncbi:uncharacterized protein PgNI_01433 [Pyricularia grisea]|uniref:Uncharacterized protein n=1 Tax=Pyricularia grisea TaxID=148305 RepID=A0A6P8BKJ3_PYRGI|nr:uncharacterized protein PgNI_01433 [Pyricularia grisea]TLD17219.1 hypothetical protein PgNI_01433 [Pyricularia grisea]